MNNQEIAQRFEELSDLLEIQGESAFKLRAYRNASQVISELGESIEQLVHSGADLTEIEGIGKSVAGKCVELVETGTMKKLVEVLKVIPRGVLDLSRVPGVGPKKAAALHRELGIATLDELRAACESHKVRELAGFGVKTESAILEGIPLAAATEHRMLWAEADRLVTDLLEHMRESPAVGKIEAAGSYRRGKETVGDIDLLVTADKVDEVMDHFGKWKTNSSVIGRGPTKMSIRTGRGIQVDLRVVPEKSFGAALQYFTGSKEHNVELRSLARKKGLRINEYGVFDADEKPLENCGATEESVYAAVGMPWIPPELREHRLEFSYTDADSIPRLISVDQIRGDLHMHTTATDGRNTIEEMAATAKQRGLEYIAITDHSRRVTMARGLDRDRLLAQWSEIDRLNGLETGSFRILKGIECDILESGEMDLEDDVLAQADWVIASLHYGQNQSRQQITDRIVGALRNPHVDIIGHPTGRLIGRRKGYDLDLKAMFEAAAEHRKFLELNASPMRLDLEDTNLITARSLGIRIVISTDAHNCDGLGDIRYGVVQARRAGLTAEDVANTLSLKKMMKLRGRKI